MSVQALRLGVSRTTECEKLWPENCVNAAQQFMIDQLQHVWTRSPEEYILSDDVALDLFQLDKSPGFPYYHKYPTKGDAIREQKDLIISLSDRLLSGDETVSSVFTLSEKSELRPADKVRSGKTRVFMASDMHHLLASKRLYEVQNMDLIDKRRYHQMPLGIRMPGPEYVRLVLSHNPVISGDLSGCDARFPLRLARLIHNVRSHFLPYRYRQGSYVLYCLVYCGVGACLGGIYRVYGNKSGWQNTAHDNSLMSWAACLIANFDLYQNQPLNSTFRGCFYSDDWLLTQLYGDVKEVKAWLIAHNVVLETSTDEHTNPFDADFLSHHIRERFVYGYGDILVAAGNLPKLRSSLNWVKPSKNLSFDETCLAHLIGLRMCLFPYPDDFEYCDGLITKFLQRHTLTQFMKEILPARFSEYDLAKLHTRTEGLGSFFYEQLGSGVASSNQVAFLNVLRRLIKDATSK